MLLCRSVDTGGKRQDLIGVCSITLTPGGGGLFPGLGRRRVQKNSAEVTIFMCVVMGKNRDDGGVKFVKIKRWILKVPVENV